MRRNLADSLRTGAGSLNAALVWLNAMAGVLIEAPKEHYWLMLNDLKYAWRTFRQARWFTATALLTLALGIGANTAIFSVVEAVLLRQLPYDNPDRILMVWVTNPQQGFDHDVTLVPAPRGLARPEPHDRGVRRLQWRVARAHRIQGPRTPSRCGGDSELLPCDGRPCRARTHVRGWRRCVWPPAHRGVEPRPLGAALRRGPCHRRSRDRAGRPTVHRRRRDAVRVPVPVPRSGRVGTSRGQSRRAHAQGTLLADDRRTAEAGRGSVAGATGDGCHFAPARWSIHAGPRSGRGSRPVAGRTDGQHSTGAVRAHRGGGVRTPDRLRERGWHAQRARLGPAAGDPLRAALGAGRGRVVRQLLTESVLLFVLGGALGLGLAAAGVRAIVRLAPPTLPGIREVSLDWTVALYALAVAAVTGLVFGAAPAIHAARRDQAQAIRGGALRVSGREGAAWFRTGLLAAQVALAFVLLTGAGLLLRSFVQMQAVDLSFDPQYLVAAPISLPLAKDDNDAKTTAFHDALAERLRATPGIESVAAITSLLLDRLPNSAGFQIEGRAQDITMPLTYDAVTPGFFRTMKIPLLRGRFFTDADRETTERVAIVNETTARKVLAEPEPDRTALSLWWRPRQQEPLVDDRWRRERHETCGYRRAGLHRVVPAAEASPLHRRHVPRSDARTPTRPSWRPRSGGPCVTWTLTNRSRRSRPCRPCWMTRWLGGASTRF